MDTSFDSMRSAPIPNELTGPIPRRLQRTGAGIYWALIAPTFLTLAVAAALWGAINTAQQVQHRAELRGGGAETVGEVTGTMRGKRADIVYYTFSVGGVSFTGKSEVPGFLR